MDASIVSFSTTSYLDVILVGSKGALEKFFKKEIYWLGVIITDSKISLSDDKTPANKTSAFYKFR